MGKGAGATKDVNATVEVDDGTLARTDTTVPGPVGLDAHSSGSSHVSPSVSPQVLGYARHHQGRHVGDGQCFALADHALSSAGARSAADFGTVTQDADYVWGTSISLADLQPGDIIQLRDYRYDREITTEHADGSSQIARRLPGAAAPHRDRRVGAGQRRGRRARAERAARLCRPPLALVLHGGHDHFGRHDHDDSGAGHVLVLPPAAALTRQTGQRVSQSQVGVAPGGASPPRVAALLVTSLFGAVIGVGRPGDRTPQAIPKRARKVCDHEGSDRRATTRALPDRDVRRLLAHRLDQAVLQRI